MKLLILNKEAIVRPRNGAYIDKPWAQISKDGALEAINSYVNVGWHPIVVSNQIAVSRSNKSLEDAFHEMVYCQEIFPYVKELFFCPDEGQSCWRLWADSEDERIRYDSTHGDTIESGAVNMFRLPQPGMLVLARHLYPVPEVNCESILYVGISEGDEKAAELLGINYEYFHEFTF